MQVVCLASLVSQVPAVFSVAFAPRPLATFEWLLVIAYIAAVIFWGYRYRESASSPEESFLAGRRLPGWVASCSTVASNLNANDFVGWAGAVYLVGLAMVHFPLHTACVICFLGVFVVRKLRAANVYSLGGWLRQRYSPTVGNVYNVIWLCGWMPFGLGLYIYAGALLLSTLVGWNLMMSIVLITVVAAVYTMMGGFRAVVATDVAQLFLMVLPLLFACAMLWRETGGPIAVLSQLPPEKADLWSSSTPFGPIEVLFFGHLAMALSFWTCDAQLVQRPLATRDQESAAVAYLGAGFWYALVVPVIAIFPGLAALQCFPELAKPDHAAPMILREFLPTGLYGMAIVGLLSGVLSSVDSTLNAFCTMFTREVYVGLMRRDATDEQQMRIARRAGIALTVIGIGTAYYFSLSDSMLVQVAKIIAVIMPPLGAITVFGAVSPAVSPIAAHAALVAGYGSSILLLALDKLGKLSTIAAEPAFFSALVTFVVTGTVAAGVTVVRPTQGKPPSDNQRSSTAVKRLAVLLAVAIVVAYTAIVCL